MQHDRHQAALGRYRKGSGERTIVARLPVGASSYLFLLFRGWQKTTSNRLHSRYRVGKRHIPYVTSLSVLSLLSAAFLPFAVTSVSGLCRFPAACPPVIVPSLVPFVASVSLSCVARSCRLCIAVALACALVAGRPPCVAGGCASTAGPSRASASARAFWAACWAARIS